MNERRYRIIPLRWVKSSHSSWKWSACAPDGIYKVFAEFRWEYRHKTGRETGGRCKSIAEAKRACERDYESFLVGHYIEEVKQEKGI